jgi:hypothetical protein
MSINAKKIFDHTLYIERCHGIKWTPSECSLRITKRYLWRLRNTSHHSKTHHRTSVVRARPAPHPSPPPFCRREVTPAPPTPTFSVQCSDLLASSGPPRSSPSPTASSADVRGRTRRTAIIRVSSVAKASDAGEAVVRGAQGPRNGTTPDPSSARFQSFFTLSSVL